MTETDLRLTWDRPMRERWRFSALDKLVPDRQTDGRTDWLPELLTEPKILSTNLIFLFILLSWQFPLCLQLTHFLAIRLPETWKRDFIWICMEIGWWDYGFNNQPIADSFISRFYRALEFQQVWAHKTLVVSSTPFFCCWPLQHRPYPLNY